MPPPTDEQIAARHASVVDSLDRRMSIVEGLAARGSEPLDWLALQRQVRHFSAYAGPTSPSRPRSEAVAAAFDSHVARLRELQAMADKELSAVDPEALTEARGRLGIRLALIGNGGAGKSVLFSSLSHKLA